MTPGGGGVIGPPVGRLGGGVARDGEGCGAGGLVRDGDGDGEGEGEKRGEDVGFEEIDEGVSGGLARVCVQATNVVAAMANVARSTRTGEPPGVMKGSACLTIAQPRYIHSNHESFVTTSGITAGQKGYTSPGI